MNQRATQRINEDLERTLYVRLPHTIKSEKQVKDLFVGDIKIKLPRQSSRHCHVVFPSVEEKMNNLKNIKKLLVNGKRIFVCPPRIKAPEAKKRKEKKIKISKPPEPESKITKTLYISNIKPGTKRREVKLAFPGCLSVVMLESTNGRNGTAILKLGSVRLAGEYLRKEREWPEVRGNKLIIKPDTRKKKNAVKKKKSTGLKIYNGEIEGSIEKRIERK